MKRMKFEAIGADSTIYRRSSTSRLYPHRMVLAPGAGNAARWRTHRRVASIEILEAMQV